MALKIKQFRIANITSGSAQQLSSSALKAESVIIIADPSNSGRLYIGDSNVNASSALGIPLDSDRHVTLEPPQQYGVDESFDLTKIYVDTTSTGDDAIISYMVRE
jgi:hypothetical protein